jgi:hypothetical protein
MPEPIVLRQIGHFIKADRAPGEGVGEATLQV